MRGEGFSAASPKASSEAKALGLARARRDAVERVLRESWGAEHFERWAEDVGGFLDRADLEALAREVGEATYRNESEDLIACSGRFEVDTTAILAELAAAGVPAPQADRARVIVTPEAGDKPGRNDERTARVGELFEEALAGADSDAIHVRHVGRTAELAAVRDGLLPGSGGFLDPARTLAAATPADIAVYYSAREAGPARQGLQGEWRVSLACSVKVVRLDSGEEIYNRSFRGRGRALELEDAYERAAREVAGTEGGSSTAAAQVIAAIEKWWQDARRDGLDYTISLSSHLDDSDVFQEFVRLLQTRGHSIRFERAAASLFANEYTYSFRMRYKPDRTSLVTYITDELNAFLRREDDVLGRAYAESAPPERFDEIMDEAGARIAATRASGGEPAGRREFLKFDRFARLAHAAGYHLVFSVYSRRALDVAEDDWRKLQQTALVAPAGDSGRDADKLTAICERIRSGVIGLRLGKERSGTWLGTGFLVSPSGLAFTTPQAVERDGGELVAQLHDGVVRPVRVVRKNGSVALIQIEDLPAGTYTFELGDIADIRVGEVAGIVGQPSWSKWYRTLGVVSSRPLEDEEENTFLYDATMYYGSHGSPIFRIDGGVRVIGIHSASIAEQGAASSASELVPVPGFAVGSSVRELRRLLDAD